MDNVIDPQERFDGENDLDSLFGNNTQSRNTSQGFDGESELDSLFGGSGTASKPVIQEAPGFFSNMGNLAIEGGRSAIAASRITDDVTTGNFDANTPGVISTSLNRQQNRYTPPELKETQEAFKDEAKAWEEADGLWEGTKAGAGFVGEMARQVFTNPKGFAYLQAEQIANMAPAIAGSLAGGKLGALAGSAVLPGPGTLAGGAVGAAGGAFAGGYDIEAGSEFIGMVAEGLAERGLEPTEKNVAYLLSDDQWRNDAAHKARIKGVTTAGTDALLTVAGGRVASSAKRGAFNQARKTLGAGAAVEDVAKESGRIYSGMSKTQRVLPQVSGAGIDIAGEGLSEGAGQYAAYGEVNPQDVAQETLAGVGGSAGEAIALGREFSRGVIKADTTDIDMMQNDGGVIPQAQPYLGEEVAGGQDYDPVKYGMEQGQYGEVIPTMTQRPSLNDQPYEPAKTVQQTDMDMTGNAPTADAYLGEEIPGANPDLVRAGLQQGQYGEVIPTRPQPEPVINTELDAKAHEAATSPLNDKPIPTQQDAEKGKYEKGKLDFQGLPISIENPKGSERSGVDPDGTPWSVKMPAHYGEIDGSKGADGDPIDITIGDKQDSNAFFVIDQENANSNDFDEHKVFAGVETPDEAYQLYLQSFSDGRGKDRFGGMAQMNREQFDEWLEVGDKTVRVGEGLNESVPDLERQEDFDVNEQETSHVVDQKTQNVDDNGVVTDHIPDAGEMVSIAPERQEFINNKVQELGSVEAVDEFYADDSPVSQYAKQRARDVFGVTGALPESTNDQQNKPSKIDTLDVKHEQESKPNQEKSAEFVGRKWKDRNGDTRQVVSVAEDRPDGWLMVSTEGKNSLNYIHVEDIQGEIDRDEANYKRNAEFLAETEKADKKAAEDKAASEDIDGFHDDKSAMQRGRTIKALTGKQIRFSDGTIATPKERVRKLVESGELSLETFEENKIKPMSRRAWNNATQREQDAHDAKVAAAGKKTIYLVNGSDLGKTAYDYAEYLQNKKLQNAERNSPLVNETAERLTKEQGVVKENSATLTKGDAKEKKGYGSDNKLVTKDRAEELRKKLREKLNQLNSGIDPEMLALGTELAVFHIEAGARSFTKFARTVVAELGERAKPYLKSWYMGARYFPGLDSSGMDTAATVEALNIDDITDGVANAAESDKVKLGEHYATDGGRYENTGAVGIQGAGESTGVQAEATGVIGQVRAGGSGRTVEDVSAEAASFAEMKAAASGNPLVLEEVQLRKEIKDLRVDKAAHDRSLWRYQDMVRKAEHINARTEDEIADIESDLQTVEANFKWRDSKEWSLEVDGKIFAPTIKEENGTAAEKKKIAKQNSDAIKAARKRAGEHLVEQINDFVAAKRTLGSHALDEVPLLKYGGIVFDIDYFGNAGGFGVSIVADDRSGHNPSVLYMDKDVDDGISATGLITRLDNILTGILDGAEQRKAELERTRKRVLADGVEARKKVGKEFDGTELLKQKESRHSDVMAELKAAEKENSEKTEAKDFTRWIRLGGPTPSVQPVGQDAETLLGLSRPANLSDGEGRLSLPVVESVVSGIVARKKWRDVEIVAVDRFESLPDDVKQGVKTYGDDTQGRGVLHKGTVYVVADEHSTEVDVEQTILHEVEGHVGVRMFYGHAATQILKKLYHEIGGNKGISRLAKKRGITELKSYANMLADSEYSDDQRVRIMMEEVFAHMAESPRFMDKAKALWGAIRKRLRSLGFKRLSEATESDLLYVLSQGRKQLVKSQQAHDDITALRVGRPTGGVGPAESTLAKASPRIKNAVDYLRMKLQDKFIPLLNMQKMLEDRGWVKNDANDAYRAEERFHGKAERRLELFTEQYVTPLMEKISGSTISIEDLESYLYAKFAPERNKYIASINESMPDGGSGMTNDEARGILAEFQRSGKTGELEALAREVRKITQLQRDIIRSEGLELDETMDAWELNNLNYVPLKGGHEETGRGIGTGFSFKRSGTKQALGRRSKAENILSELFSQAGATIVRAEKAKVQRAFLEMVEQNPDESLWKVYDPKNKATLPTKRKLSNNPVLKRIKRKISKRTYLLNNGNLSETRRAAVEAEIAELEVQASGIKERLVKDVIDPSLLTGDNVMTITREDGSVVYVDIADNDLARVMKNMTQNQYGPITKALGVVTRYLSRMSTSFNPEFVVTNFERDIQTAMAHLGTEQSGKLAMQVLKSVPKAMGGIRRNLRKGDKTSEWAVWYERFQDAGAQVSFMDLRGVEEWNRQLASLGKKGALDGSKATVKKIGEFINDYNTVVENAVRLSAFKTAIESGMSESDAASMAKNLTVNFNRKGELGPAMNALYMFANAGVQGSARILQALTNKKSRKRMGKLMGSVVAMSFALAELNRLSAGDDDDDENRWDKIGDYTKQVNLIFATDEGEWKIRTPYGYNSFVALGYALNDLYHYSIGDGGKSPSEVSWFMVSTLKNAFNPLGGDESLMKILSPTITDPIVELTTNENFMGENIRPENFQFGPQKPDSQLYFRTVSQASKSVTGWLNRVTGGSEWEPGMIDVSPETLDHLFGFAFGGVGRSVMRIADLPAKITNGELQVRNVPFARQVYQEKVPYVDFDRFYDNMNKISASRAAVKEMPVNQRRSYIADHPEIRMAKMAGRYNRQLSKMRERYYALKDSGQHEQAKNMQERMQAHVLRFNKVYNGIVD